MNNIMFVFYIYIYIVVKYTIYHYTYFELFSSDNKINLNSNLTSIAY